MDWLLFSLFFTIFLWLIVLSFVGVRLWSQNGKRLTEIMLLEALVRPKSPRGNPVHMKVQPLMQKEPKVQVGLLKDLPIDLTELDDEIIL